MTRALDLFLKPLNHYLNDNEVSEIVMNRECELFVEKRGAFDCHHEPLLNKERVTQLAQLIAEYNNKTISQTNPLLSATLPSGARCQFVLPPACDLNQIIFSIRKPSTHEIELKDWFKNGLLKKDKKNDFYKELGELKEKGDYGLLMETAILGKCNMIISGGTSTAKTTFLNTCLKKIPLHERIITIEDVRETQTPHPNVAHLLATDNDDPNLNSHKTSMLDLLKASLRLRPDRIFLAELRGNQAYPFLRAAISGHPGSMTTLHADTIEHAKTQLKFMLAESKELQYASNERLIELIDSSIDIIVQMDRAGSSRAPSDIYIKGL
jgi:type IV secretion system protein VirB11